MGASGNYDVVRLRGLRFYKDSAGDQVRARRCQLLRRGTTFPGGTNWCIPAKNGRTRAALIRVGSFAINGGSPSEVRLGCIALQAQTRLGLESDVSRTEMMCNTSRSSHAPIGMRCPVKIFVSEISPTRYPGSAEVTSASTAWFAHYRRRGSGGRYGALLPPTPAASPSPLGLCF